MGQRRRPLARRKAKDVAKGDSSIGLSNKEPLCSPNPGLTHTPRSEKSEVTFSPKDFETYLPYTRAMKEFLEKYDDEHQTDQRLFDDCGGRRSTIKTNGRMKH